MSPGWRRLLAAVAAGGVGVAGFGPFGYPWAALASAAALAWLWWDASPRAAAWLGFAFGAGLFGVGVSWVYVSIHVYGQMPPWMAVVVVVVFVAILSLYPALVGWLYRRWLARHRVAGTVVGLPALWGLAEWGRSWVLSGFPWLSLGYSQVDAWLAGWSPVLGVYGVSWLVMLTAVLVVLGIRQAGRYRLGAAAAIAAVWLGGLGFAQVQWSAPAGDALRVALVQGNVSLDRKWAESQRPVIMNRYLDLSQGTDERDLIVWPEAALPYFIDQVGDATWRRLERHPADFLFGLLERRADARRVRTFNSAVAVTQGEPQIYRKAHLVPLGEYVPFEPLLGWIIDYLEIPMSNFDAWQGHQGPLRAAGTAIGVTICYEDAFPEQLMKPLPAAALLANISEDAWFGDSLAPHQRIQMARMRALETARPMLRAANTGVSAIIDHRGTVTASTRQFVTTVLQGEVQPMQGTTPYVTWGNTGIVVVTLALLAIGVGVNRRLAGAATDTAS